MTTKICTVCGGDLPLTDFPKQRDCRDGHRNQCITCRNEYNADYVRRRRAADPVFRARITSHQQRYRQRLETRLKRNPKLRRYFLNLARVRNQRYRAQRRAS